MRFSRFSFSLDSMPYGVNRFLRLAAFVIVAFIVFIMGLWIFCPWAAVAELALARTAVKAAESGFVMTAGAVESSGTFEPVLSINSIQIRNAFVDMKCHGIDVAMSPWSLMSGNFVALITVKGGNLMMPDGQMVVWNEGGAAVNANVAGVRVNDIFLKGDLSASGKIELDLPSGLPRVWDMSFKVPSTLDNTFEIIKYSIPLEKTGEGEWRLVKNETSN